MYSSILILVLQLIWFGGYSLGFRSLAIDQERVLKPRAAFQDFFWIKKKRVLERQWHCTGRIV